MNFVIAQYGVEISLSNGVSFNENNLLTIAKLVAKKVEQDFYEISFEFNIKVSCKDF